MLWLTAMGRLLLNLLFASYAFMLTLSDNAVSGLFQLTAGSILLILICSSCPVRTDNVWRISTTN